MTGGVLASIGLKVDAVTWNQQIWWYVTRSTGLVAWAMASASMLWGLALSSRAFGSRPRAPWLLDLHRWLGGLTLTFTVLHLLALIADTYVRFTLVDVLVPFATSWHPAAVAAGITAWWLLVAVQLTSVFSRHLSKQAWRRVHLTSYLAFLAATGHAITAGTDIGSPLVQWLLLLGTVGVTFLGIYRLVGPGKAAVRRSTPEAVA